jgi:hypothetical protein
MERFCLLEGQSRRPTVDRAYCKDISEDLRQRVVVLRPDDDDD